MENLRDIGSAGGARGRENEDARLQVRVRVRVLTVTDLHQSTRLYGQLAEAVTAHRPDVVAFLGDFLDVPVRGTGLLTVEECAVAIAGLDVPEVVLVRGNHEDWNYLTFAEALKATGRAVATLHGEEHVRGPMTMVGFPTQLGDETAFTLQKAPLGTHPGGWLSRLVRRVGPPARTVWLLHEPPSGTPLTVSAGPISGNPEWSEAIQRYTPWLVVFGHDHATPIARGRWHHRVGETLVVNVGQPHDGVLHYALIDAEFEDARPSLPGRLTVRAFPWDQVVEAGPGGRAG